MKKTKEESTVEFDENGNGERDGVQVHDLVHRPRKTKEVPPKPEGTVESGEKTRAVCEWLRDYGTPEEKEKVARWAKILKWADGLPPE